MASHRPRADTERKNMSPPDIVDAYFDAWNLHDPDLITDCFGQDGCYRDPYVPGGVEGRAIGEFARGLFLALPALNLEMIRRNALADGRIVVEWLLQTGSGVQLAGVDFITLQCGRILAVQGY